MSRLKIIRTCRGASIQQDGIVLSEVLAQPGPTHSVVDVIAAAVQALAPGARLALLGFEAGGLLAPLRAMGGTHSIEAVDLTDRSYAIFQRFCRPWCGPVELQLADAADWAQAGRSRFDAIVVDLSVVEEGEVATPASVWLTLPRLVRARLRRSGWAVFNLLRPRSVTWAEAFERIARPFAAARLVSFAAFENRLVLAGPEPLPARKVSRRIRSRLEIIRSRLARPQRISVRSLPFPKDRAQAG